MDLAKGEFGASFYIRQGSFQITATWTRPDVLPADTGTGTLGPLYLTISESSFKGIPKISLEWVDERFQWNPGEYGAVESIRVQGKDIWFPSIKDLLILT